MSNHKDVSLAYDANSIIDVLQGYPLPTPTYSSLGINSCNIQEIIKISNILNLGLPIKSILYFRIGENFRGYIHKDIDLNTPNSVIKNALNLPLMNCDQVYMKWFTQKDPNINIKSFDGPSSGSPTPLLDRSNATCIDSVLCNGAKLVSIDDWHAIENHSLEKIGFLISIRFASSVNPLTDLKVNELLPVTPI